MKQDMNPRYPLLLTVIFVLPLLSTALFAGDDFTPLFDGKSLKGWHNPYDWGEARVEDGEIHLKGDKKFFLVSDKTYADFVLKAEVKVPDRESNSGIQFRSHKEKNRVWGYQAEVDPSDRKWAGGLYDEGRRGWLHPLKDHPDKQEAFNPEEWNEYRIKCVGDHIQIWVNGTQTTDYRDAMDLSGHIALQHHGEEGKVYRFRNVRIKTLGKHTWTPLFNGNNLNGWHTKPGGTWEVRDEVIVGTSPASESRHGLLISDQAYEDFTARIEFRVKQGNSGFYFRSKEVDEAVGMHGFQAEVAENNTGGLYETAGRAWVVQPDQEKVNEVYRKKDWNQMTVSAHGGWIVVHLNDQKMAELRDDPGRKKGHFGLQLHGGQDMHVEFRNIQLLKQE